MASAADSETKDPAVALVGYIVDGSANGSCATLRLRHEAIMSDASSELLGTIPTMASAAVPHTCDGSSARRCVRSHETSGVRRHRNRSATMLAVVAMLATLTCAGCGGDADAERAAATRMCDSDDEALTSRQAGPNTSAAAAGDDGALSIEIEDARGILVDANDRPFLIKGDTAWSLIAGLTREDAELYLSDRAERGFNTILVELIEHHFVANPPANAYGDEPFTSPGDFASPNESYFQHADWVIARAAELGLLVLLTPAYVGYGGGPEGWYAEMEAAGVDVLRDYGRYLGRRYALYDNIIWVNAGDAIPARPELVDAVATGIRETDPDALQTAHGAPGAIVADHFGSYEWFDVNNVYTYEDPHSYSVEQYAAGNRPFFFLEGTYENEHEAETKLIRIQAYHSLLGGATGHVFGNNPIWHFDGPGLFPVDGTWQDALDSPGTVSMQHAFELFDQLAWWDLVPDVCSELFRDGTEGWVDRTVSAITSDRSLAIVYFPGGRTVEADLNALAGDTPTLTWVDPTNGEFGETSSVDATTDFELTPPGANAAGDDDWILLINA